MATTKERLPTGGSSPFYWTGTHQVEIYADPGTTVTLGHETGGLVYNEEFSIAGYLEDIG